MIKLTMPDGSIREAEAGISALELVKSIPTLPRRKCLKPCDTWSRACFFENNYIPTVYSFISVLIFRKSPLV